MAGKEGLISGSQDPVVKELYEAADWAYSWLCNIELHVRENPPRISITAPITEELAGHLNVLRRRLGDALYSPTKMGEEEKNG